MSIIDHYSKTVFIISAQPRVTSFRDMMHDAEEESDEEEGQR